MLPYAAPPLPAQYAERRAACVLELTLTRASTTTVHATATSMAGRCAAVTVGLCGCCAYALSLTPDRGPPCRAPCHSVVDGVTDTADARGSHGHRRRRPVAAGRGGSDASVIGVSGVASSMAPLRRHRGGGRGTGADME